MQFNARETSRCDDRCMPLSLDDSGTDRGSANLHYGKLGDAVAHYLELSLPEHSDSKPIAAAALADACRVRRGAGAAEPPLIRLHTAYEGVTGVLRRQIPTA
ncbi:hypothetical protein [Aureimonas leprariae]|uniref:Uncharacterized protein n=1 Tax=Plantimonas leprariae TaxID=2615207 RepID=A0A7V7PKE1_9HYPH|nr:hypothetical protein [Aureimonas leprariae]KAB0676022.1 hypothetical protein F6X38_22435 [Aureimonas leprariae]